MKTIFCALLVLVAASTSLAQTNKKTTPVPVTAHIKWDKEPEAVFGIKLGDSIPAGSFPECILPSRANGYKNPTEMCIESGPGPYAGKIATLHAAPLPQVSSTATINLDDTLVSSIHINFHHENHEKMRAILIERYGPPTKTDISTVQTGAGASFQAETLAWEGAKNSVRLFERWDTASKSLAVFSSNQLSEKQGNRILKSLKDSASKL